MPRNRLMKRIPSNAGSGTTPFLVPLFAILKLGVPFTSLYVIRCWSRSI